MKLILFLLAVTTMSCAHKSHKPVAPATEKIAPKAITSSLISNVKQLTFTGKRTGEGYFSADGKWMVAQSEREKNNPFYQIYLWDLETGRSHRVSPGIGKTTCAWIHPSKKKIMFASTHEDPKAKWKMQQKLEERRTGIKKKYSWDYDKTYELYESSPSGKRLKNLTNALGYDAEGSYSPNGKLIAFASNRHGYTEKLSPEDQEIFSKDNSYMMDIYIMNSDGSNVKRLTTAKGYDGGPFFSADGTKITWRRFSPEGHMAEIYTMNIDGSDQKKITKLKTMSWAPYFHPSGDYIVFATNIHGYKNFELYIVDAEGLKEPVRVTNMEGFDGLPVFTPDGSQLTWTRRGHKFSQIYSADWDDQKARELLGLSQAPPKALELAPSIRVSDLKKHTYYLASPELRGRASGSTEEVKYTNTIASLFRNFGLKTFNSKSYIHEFDFLSGASISQKSFLNFMGEKLELGKDWTPLTISNNAEINIKEFVFADYGIQAPEAEGVKAYNSYKDLDVKGKWVLVLRDLPRGISTKARLHLLTYSRRVNKVMIARQQGAKGVIFLTGGNPDIENQLIRFKSDEATVKNELPTISVTDEVIEKMLVINKTNLKQLLTAKNNKPMKTAVLGKIDIKHKTSIGRNIAGLIKVPGARNTIIIGAHGDHLGEGLKKGSLMAAGDKVEIHHGADDNASGVASVLELAHYFSKNRKQLKQNVLFTIWSAEELGVIGSKAFIEKNFNKNSLGSLTAYLNLDMVGRLKEKLIINGVASSSQWRSLVEQAAIQENLNISMSDDPYVPTDGISFYLSKVPSVTLFTGAHSDYHKPSDTPEKINYKGLYKITHFAKGLTQQIASQRRTLPYEEVKRSHNQTTRGFRIYLGTIPDYSKKLEKGVKISGVIKGGPAEKAGLKKGDIILKFSQFQISNIYDYVYALQSLKPNIKTDIEVLRAGKTSTFSITPKLKE